MISTAGDIADFYERLFIGDFLGPEMLSAMLILVQLQISRPTLHLFTNG